MSSVCSGECWYRLATQQATIWAFTKLKLDNGKLEEKSAISSDWQTSQLYRQNTARECAKAILNRQNPASYNMGIYEAKRLDNGELEGKIDYQQRLQTARKRVYRPK